LIRWDPVVLGGDGVKGLPPFAEEKAARTPRTAAREVPILVVLAITLAFVVKSLVAQAFYIPSVSMVPTLKVHDRVVVSRVAYRMHPPHRGDIVVFDEPPAAQAAIPIRKVHVSWPVLPLEDRILAKKPIERGHVVVFKFPEDPTRDFIKRVIGLPGETVDIHGGHVYIDGQLLVEPYLPPGTVTVGAPGAVKLPITVPPDQVWLMGDNRSQSFDSRYWGTVKRSHLIGRAIVRAWPPGRIGFL